MLSSGYPRITHCLAFHKLQFTVSQEKYSKLCFHPCLDALNRFVITPCLQSPKDMCSCEPKFCFNLPPHSGHRTFTGSAMLTLSTIVTPHLQIYSLVTDIMLLPTIRLILSVSLPFLYISLLQLLRVIF